MYPATFNEHWLFCRVVAAPGAAATHVDPLSWAKLIWLAAGL